MTDDEKRDAETLAFLVNYFKECRERGLTPEQTAALVRRAADQAKAIVVQERRTAFHIVKPPD